MTSTEVTGVYKYVIDEVIKSVRNDFLNMGVDEHVLNELQQSWETKLIQSKVLHSEYEANIHDSPIIPSTRDDAFLHRSAMTSGSPYYSTSQLPSAASLASLATPKTATGTSRRPNVNQNDGASDEPTTAEIDHAIQQRISKKASKLGIQQVDGIYDSDEDDNEGDDDLDNFESTNALNPIINANEINSDLDDLDDSEEEEDADNYILCQYDKVTRTKNKWRCSFKDGVMHINNRDYLFFKATGEFEW